MSVLNGAVAELARSVWAARDRQTLCRDAAHLARRMYVAVAEDAADGYDPEIDLRVAWLREVIGGLRRGERRPVADDVMEEWVAYTLGIEVPKETPADWKMAAAGGW